MKKILTKISAGSAMILTSGAVFAAEKGLTGRFDSWTGLLESVGSFAYAVAFLIGLFLAINGLINIKKYADNPQQNPLTKPLIYFVVGAFLMGLTAWNTLIADDVVGSSNSTQLNKYDNLN